LILNENENYENLIEFLQTLNIQDLTLIWFDYYNDNLEELLEYLHSLNIRKLHLNKIKDHSFIKIKPKCLKLTFH